MVKSFSVITGLALAVLAHASYVPQEPEYKPEYKPEPEPEYVPVYEATTTPCTASSDYPAPTGYGHSSSVVVDYPSEPTPTGYPSYTSSSAVDYGYPVSSSVDVGYPVENPPVTTYTAVYTSCEIYPTVYTFEGTPVSSDCTTTHYMTTTLCESTPVETHYPTTITKSYETTYSSCLTYPTTCSTSGTYYTTDVSTTEYSTSTVCSTEVYTPVPSSYYTNIPVASYTPGTVSPPVGTGYPQPPYPANHTTYAAVPTYPVSTGGAATLAPSLAAFAAVVGGVIAALF